MTQSIVIQVGQCGNQIGCRFWDLCLREHAHYSKKGVYDDAMSSFFRNTDGRYENPINIPVGDGRQKISNLKARAILIDMEEGVVNELLQGYMGEIFDSKQLITDVSGSGNNWAVGHKEYGEMYKEQIIDQVRKAAEMCDCLQCFFIIHSMGGGTGSGLGTAVLGILKDEFPEVYRFVTAVYPSEDDDVITSPYNSMLAMNQLTMNADCVMPIDNQSLYGICTQIQQALPKKSILKQSTVLSSTGTLGGQNEKPFDKMNNIVANSILNLTSSSRFEGSLNVDLNEIAMNLVPFPRLHYLVSGVSPLYIDKDIELPPRKLDQAFTDIFNKKHQLVDCDPRHSMYLACALIARGDVQVSDLRKNIDRLRPSLNFIHWNQDGWKTGLCNLPPVGQPYSLLALSNNTCVRHSFSNLRSRFMKLYKRKAHIHHYTQISGFDQSLFTQSAESLTSLIAEYDGMEKTVNNTIPRLQVL